MSDANEPHSSLIFICHLPQPSELPLGLIEPTISGKKGGNGKRCIMPFWKGLSG